MLEGMKAGADDYLVKPIDQLELEARLLVGKTKPTGAYMRRSKMAGIVWRRRRMRPDVRGGCCKRCRLTQCHNPTLVLKLMITSFSRWWTSWSTIGTFQNSSLQLPGN